jgi:hypothetical protein
VLTFVGGLVLWLGLPTALQNTGNINLVPSLIVLGAALGPVVFVLYVYERAREVPWPLLFVCFIAGGVLGVTAASVLEYRTLLGLGALPTIAIGLIEETCKLIVPVAIFIAGRYRREADGLLFGVGRRHGLRRVRDDGLRPHHAPALARADHRRGRAAVRPWGPLARRARGLDGPDLRDAVARPCAFARCGMPRPRRGSMSCSRW